MFLCFCGFFACTISKSILRYLPNREASNTHVEGRWRDIILCIFSSRIVSKDKKVQFWV